MDFLNVCNLHVSTVTGPVLKGISFTVQPLQHIAIAGATGSGKSSLMKAIAGLAQPTEGQIFFEGKRVLGPEEKLLPGHPAIAYLSQHFELRNNYRVEEELECVNQMSEKEAARIYAICEVDHLLKRRTDQLSGGEKQRIVTARLLTTRPRLFLLDEPFSNLDLAHKQAMQRVIGEISAQLHITCMLVTHDPQDSLPWAQQILVLRAGELIQKGTPREVYYKPVDAYAAGLLGKYNLLTPAQAAAFGCPVEALIRLEDVCLITDNKAGVPGTIRTVKFFGSYYELELMAADALLWVRTTENNWTPGDTVHLAIREPNH